MDTISMCRFSSVRLRNIGTLAHRHISTFTRVKHTVLLSSILLLAATSVMRAQFWYEPGPVVKGKIRIIENDYNATTATGGLFEHIRFRTFSVDSVFPESAFGNHYKYLRGFIKQDAVASVYALNALYWERTQRICIAGAVGWGVATLLISTDQQMFNNFMWVECGIVGAMTVSYFIKRHWANKSIRTWNKHLDEGLYHYQP